MAEYENQRLIRMQQNRAKMEELGIKTIAYEATCLMKDHKRQKISKPKSKRVFANDDGYIPVEESEQDQSSEEDDNESMQNSRSLRSRSNKVMANRGENLVKSTGKQQCSTTSMVMASRGGNLVKSTEKPQCSTTSMASLVKMHSQTHKNQEQQRKGYVLGKNQNRGVSSQGKSQQMASMATGKTLPLRIQQEKEIESNTLVKKGQIKTLVAPGSLGAYVRMKEKSREKEQQSKQIDVFLKEPAQVRNVLSFDQPMESSRKQQASYSQMQLFDGDSGCKLGLVDENDSFDSSDDCVYEEEKDADPNELENDVAEIRNESIPIQGQQNDQLVPQKEKRTRGPSMCKDVHGWTINDRKPIILNEMGQPIGPDKVTLDKFSRFLGSLSRDSTLAPLNKLNWHRVLGKDKIWDYVKKKYMIAEEGKDYVLHSIGALWRSHKSRIKKKHYSLYDNVDDRWKYRPTSIPDSHFKELIEYWDLEEVQEISKVNKERRDSQKDRHTMGPVAFARKRHELQQTEKKPPSQALMYRETRKRIAGKKYKTSYEPIERNIDQMEEVQTQKQIGGDDAYYEVIKKSDSGHHRLFGRCTNRAKGPSKSGVLIPDEFLQPYKAHIVKDTVGEVMKILKQQLSSEMFASIAPSFEDSLSVPEFANHLINEQPSGGINDIEQCQDDVDKDNGANHDDGLERQKERIENEEHDHEDY